MPGAPTPNPRGQKPYRASGTAPTPKPQAEIPTDSAFGLTSVERDGGGNIKGGIDTQTGQRVEMQGGRLVPVGKPNPAVVAQVQQNAVTPTHVRSNGTVVSPTTAAPDAQAGTPRPLIPTADYGANGTQTGWSYGTPAQQAWKEAFGHVPGTPGHPAPYVGDNRPVIPATPATPLPHDVAVTMRAQERAAATAPTAKPPVAGEPGFPVPITGPTPTATYGAAASQRATAAADAASQRQHPGPPPIGMLPGSGATTHVSDGTLSYNGRILPAGATVTHLPGGKVVFGTANGTPAAVTAAPIPTTPPAAQVAPTPATLPLAPTTGEAATPADPTVAAVTSFARDPAGGYTAPPPIPTTLARPAGEGAPYVPPAGPSTSASPPGLTPAGQAGENARQNIVNGVVGAYKAATGAVRGSTNAAADYAGNLVPIPGVSTAVKTALNPIGTAVDAASSLLPKSSSTTRSTKPLIPVEKPVVATPPTAAAPATTAPSQPKPSTLPRVTGLADPANPAPELYTPGVNAAKDNEVAQGMRRIGAMYDQVAPVPGTKPLIPGESQPVASVAPTPTYKPAAKPVIPGERAPELYTPGVDAGKDKAVNDGMQQLGSTYNQLPQLPDTASKSLIPTDTPATPATPAATTPRPRQTAAGQSVSAILGTPPPIPTTPPPVPVPVKDDDEKRKLARQSAQAILN